MATDDKLDASDLWNSEAVYRELRRLAGHLLANERSSHTLQATALVNEAWLRLNAGQTGDFQDVAHFYSVAASTMRRSLVDHARRRGRIKFGTTDFAARERRVLGELPDPTTLSDQVDLLALDEALTRLSKIDERACRIVELRLFTGLTDAEIASLLGLSDRTVKREWAMARSWLYTELHPSDSA